MVATAESCTGGRVADLITDVSGSSGLSRGVVVYSNEAKQQRLGVRPETLSAHGAVSEETVREMALEYEIAQMLTTESLACWAWWWYTRQPVLSGWRWLA